jgi:hypothetical protein
VVKIEDIEWHDQLLTSVKIDRYKPGHNDSIELNVLVDDSEMVLTFTDVYFADLKLNFGIIAEETIRYAIVKDDDSEIFNIKKEWKNVGVYLDDLFCFEINTNSTNSLIKIFALSYTLKKANVLS